MRFSPFGFRIFISVDTNSLENIGTTLLTGEIVDISSEIKIIRNGEIRDYVRDMNTLLYYLSDELEVGKKIKFKFDEKFVDVNNNIYNVPLEFIREIEYEK